MKIADLAARTTVSPASIKYYVREGLLPAGERVGHNQTEYGDAHVERLRLIRALIEVGGLSVAAARSVLAEIDDTEAPLVRVLSVAQHAASIDGEAASRASVEAVTSAIARRALTVEAHNPGVRQCAAVLDAYASLGRADLAVQVERYLGPALEIAEADLELVALAQGDRDVAAQTVVLGTALGDTLLAGLRRIAQEHVARREAGSDVTTVTTAWTEARS